MGEIFAFLVLSPLVVLLWAGTALAVLKVRNAWQGNSARHREGASSE